MTSILHIYSRSCQNGVALGPLIGSIHLRLSICFNLFCFLVSTCCVFLFCFVPAYLKTKVVLVGRLEVTTNGASLEHEQCPALINVLQREN